MDVYKNCPVLENENYILRSVSLDDCLDLLEVYSDTKSVPFFNSDNCHGETFYYSTEEQMRKAIEYWFFEYERKGFVRWSIIDKSTQKSVGTIELFHRKAKDYFTNCGLLRLDLKSEYEKTDIISDILTIIISPTYKLFHCNKIATKAIPSANNRISALKSLGFSLSDKKLIGHDGTEYSDYYVIKK